MERIKPRYPELSRLIEKGLEDSRRAGRRYTVRTAQGEISKRGRKISVATFAAWKGGHRAPRKENIPSLADLFYPDSPEDRLAFTANIERAIDPLAEQEGKTDLEASLKIGAISYEPISHPEEPGQGFLDHFLRRMLIYGDLKFSESFANVTLEEAIVKFETRELDILAGAMSTVDRNKKLHFLSTPISFPVNAIALEDHLLKLSDNPDVAAEKVRSALTALPGGKKGGSGLVKLHPIVRPGEVGGLYCRLALNLKTEADSRDVTLAQRYTPRDYLESLKSQEPRADRFPVIVVEEIMCLRILIEARGSCVLLFDPNDKKALMPRYSVGFAVSRLRKDLISYLDDALPVYLRADANFLRERYVQLFNELKDIARDALGPEKGTKQTDWALYALGLEDLDRQLDLGYGPGWQMLLKRTCEQIKPRATSTQMEKEN